MTDNGSRDVSAVSQPVQEVGFVEVVRLVENEHVGPRGDIVERSGNLVDGLSFLRLARTAFWVELKLIGFSCGLIYYSLLSCNW